MHNQPILKTDQCPTCGAQRPDRYCSNCGEKKIDHHDYSVVHFLEEAIDTFTHFDGKFFKSIKYLLFYPGKLTADYLSGKRVKLMKPFQLYIIINLVYFFLIKSADIFMVYLKFYIQKSNMEFHKKAYEMAVGKAVQKRISLEQYIERFDLSLPDTAKAFVILLIPILSLGIWILYFNRKKQFIPHLIFAVHLFSFALVFTLFYTEAVIVPMLKSGFFINNKGLIWLFSPLIITIYTYFALKRVYQDKIWVTMTKTILLIAWFVIVQQAYRIGIVYVHFFFV